MISCINFLICQFLAFTLQYSQKFRLRRNFPFLTTNSKKLKAKMSSENDHIPGVSAVSDFTASHTCQFITPSPSSVYSDTIKGINIIVLFTTTSKKLKAINVTIFWGSSQNLWWKGYQILLQHTPSLSHHIQNFIYNWVSGQNWGRRGRGTVPICQLWVCYALCMVQWKIN